MARLRIAPVHIEGGAVLFSQFSGALTRAFLVMLLVATPSVLLPGVGLDGKQMVALIALFAGVLTFVEYNATYPSLIEFRDAGPFNRVRFCILFFSVFFIALMQRGAAEPTTMGNLIDTLGYLIGQSMDFPYSPVRLAQLMVDQNSSASQMLAVRNAAAVAYMVSITALAIFAVLMRTLDWPARNGAFNVWVNLPTFDPTAGGDVMERLERDAKVNIALGLLLPFLIPVIVKYGGSDFVSLNIESPQTMIWVISAWAFLPASLFMRGMAMGRIADMIREKRRRNGEETSPGYVPA